MSKATTVETKRLDKREDLTPEEAAIRAEELQNEKARIAQVLAQGLVTDMIRVEDGDPNRRYIYVRERDVDVQKYEALGYRVETEAGEGKHGTASNKRRVGDVILMSVPKDRHDLIEQVRAERVKTRLNSPVREYKDKSAAGVKSGSAVEALDLMKE